MRLTEAKKRRVNLPRRAALMVVSLLVAASVAGVPRAETTNGQWSPAPEIYDVGTQRNVPVTMEDGTVLRAHVSFPVDPATGAPATGPFPVVLTQTPYGKTISGYLEALAGGANPYLIKRGYIHVVADIRGTGGSQGTWGPLDPIQAKDGAALVRWAAELPNANGRVGTVGPSYLGLIQLMTAAEIGPNSPLKAIFPIVVGADLYRDVIFQGGIVDIEFSAWYLPLMALANAGNPILELATEPQAIPAVEADHARMLTDFHASIVPEIATNGDRAFHNEYWDTRSPSGMVQRIVDNGIPAFIAGGWRDLFQRRTPLLYSGFQNAYAGRPVDAPMDTTQSVTGRYQLLMGPWFHVQYGEGIALDPILLKWFDTFLKDEPTGMDADTTPFHTYEMGSGRLVDVARYPIEEAPPRTFYFGEGGSLSTVPAATAGEDTVAFTGVSNPCTLSTQQWGAGALIVAGALPAPCGGPELAPAVSPASLSYTTEAFDADAVIAGPIGATLYATSTRPDTELITTLYDVAPGGAATQISTGALLGSFRELDAERTWTGADGLPFRPWHHYTRESVRPVVPGEVTRFDIEIFPTFTRLAAGHRLRVVITTSDTPHLLPMPGQMLNLIGGVYGIQRGPGASSSIQVPLAPAGVFSAPCSVCG
ncbi:MAG: CocE/NonD family hydrolase [Actinomycetota bacterium]